MYEKVLNDIDEELARFGEVNRDICHAFVARNLIYLVGRERVHQHDGGRVYSKVHDKAAVKHVGKSKPWRGPSEGGNGCFRLLFLSERTQWRFHPSVGDERSGNFAYFQNLPFRGMELSSSGRHNKLVEILRDGEHHGRRVIRCFQEASLTHLVSEVTRMRGGAVTIPEHSAWRPKGIGFIERAVRMAEDDGGTDDMSQQVLESNSQQQHPPRPRTTTGSRGSDAAGA